MRFILAVTRNRHPAGGGERSGSVARSEQVVFGFVALEKTADAAVLLDARQQLAPSGQNLMRVSLVAHVPDDAIARRVKSIMKRDGQFDSAQACARVAADTRHRFEDVLAILLRP